MSQQYVLVAKQVHRILDCICKEVASRSRVAILPLSPGEASPGMLCPVLGSSAQERHGAPGVVQQGVTKLINILEHLSYEDRLRELGLFTHKKKQLRWALINVYKYLKGGSQEDGSRLCLVVPSKEKGQWADTEAQEVPPEHKNFSVKMTEHWNRLPRKAVESLSLETFKNHLDAIPCNVLWEGLGGLDGWAR
ncbi:hypothetical protein DUI87_22409 [Hirundo rustica rustica]|uniref:Uncharacterized protein n=1 Tax=Hirundo rustica rustica TaxID=333673 RepID=A0A3M0JJP8_HIRRU|nr:hypothetical protein DUI87_22409 [Hirundo rustica rustica]